MADEILVDSAEVAWTDVDGVAWVLSVVEEITGELQGAVFIQPGLTADVSIGPALTAGSTTSTATGGIFLH